MVPAKQSDFFSVAPEEQSNFSVAPGKQSDFFSAVPAEQFNLFSTVLVKQSILSVTPSSTSRAV